jgi:predicted ATPase
LPSEDLLDRAAVLEQSAVQLFIARLHDSRSQLEPHDEDVAIIGAICRRLDGIPLALEMAAARAAAFGVGPVLSHLKDRFALLAQGRRTALPRHQTLRATVDWSYELLPEPERRLLRRLAVFPTGFALDAAIAVVSDDAAERSQVVDGIANLAAKSLLAVEETNTTNRWRLLETTRTYALEKLAESGETEHAVRRHAEYFRDLLVSDDVGLKPEPTPERMNRFAREIGNVRAALVWAFSKSGDAEIALVLTAAYVPVWLHLSLVTECREWVERSLSGLQRGSISSPRTRMELTITLEFAIHYTTRPSEADEMRLAEALEAARAMEALDWQLRALAILFARRLTTGNVAAAQEIAARFSRVAHRTGDLANILAGDRLVGTAAHYAGDQLEARQRLQRVVDLYVPPSDQRHTQWFLHDQHLLARAVLARVLWLQGRLDQAYHHAQTSVEEAKAAGHKLLFFYVLANTACRIFLEAGDFARFEPTMTMVKDLVEQSSGTYWSRWKLYLEAEFSIKQGETATGVAMLSRMSNSGRGEWMMHYPEHLRTLAEGLAAAGDVTAAAATIEETLARADGDGGRWYGAELLRMKGELILRTARRQAMVEAEECFQRALAIAHGQSALFWELRAALSLAGLRVRQDRHDDARNTLSPVYDRFTEGFEAADLRSARMMLAALNSRAEAV